MSEASGRFGRSFANLPLRSLHWPRGLLSQEMAPYRACREIELGITPITGGFRARSLMNIVERDVGRSRGDRLLRGDFARTNRGGSHQEFVAMRISRSMPLALLCLAALSAKIRAEPPLRVGILGDSYSDEYQFYPPDRAT